MIRIVTDSTADLPADVAERLGITVIPAILVIDGQAYEDGVHISREEFYARLPEMSSPPTTSAPASGMIAATYERCFSEGADQVVSFHVASTLSAICNAAQIAAQPFDARVHVIDSGQLSLGLGFQVMAAARAAAAGGTLQEVLDAARRVRGRLQVVAMLDTLEYLRRGGRVSALKARLGSMLKMRLFVELHEGQINFLEQVRTRTKALDRLWELIVSLGKVDQLALLHAGAAQEIERLRDQLGPDLPAETFIVNVNTVIGAHVGPGALGFAAVLQERR